MTEGQPVRACAIQLIEDPEEAPLITLWETDARFQGALRDCEALEHTRSRGPRVAGFSDHGRSGGGQRRVA